MSNALSFTVFITNLDDAGSSHPHRRYVVTATPLGGGEVWRSDFLSEHQYLAVIMTLVPEKAERMRPAPQRGSSFSPIKVGDLVFSEQEIRDLGLRKTKDKLGAWAPEAL